MGPDPEVVRHDTTRPREGPDVVGVPGQSEVQGNDGWRPVTVEDVAETLGVGAPECRKAARVRPRIQGQT